MKNKVTMVNIISSVIVQLLGIVSALIIPRMVLSYFGSNINGIVASITQFLSFITIVEGGATGVVMANLYKPLTERDKDKLSAVLVTAKQFNQKIGFIFCIYALCLAIVFPITKETGYTNIYIFVLTLILSISSMIEYLFSLTLRTLLTADKKAYIINVARSGIIIVNIILSIISVKIYPNILLLKFVNSLLFIFQPIIFGIYVKRQYDIDWKVDADNQLLKSRWDGFAINIAFYIHECTDIAVLTLFASFSDISIYSIYILILNKLKVFILSVTDSVVPTIGQAYAKGDADELNEKMDIYEYIVFILTFFPYTMVGLLIAPFAMIYTHGVTDANYYQPVLGWLIVIAETFYLVRAPHVSLAYSANKFKEITVPAYIEAILNIGISIAAVYKYGIIGVVFGTIVAMAYRTCFHIWFTKKIIETRKQWIFYKKLILFALTSMIGVLVCYIFFPITNFGIVEWLGHAVIYGCIIGGILVVISISCFKKELLFLKGYLQKK